MGLDIRIPIGLMFTALGLLLAGYGLLGDPGLYHRSLGININLWWGAGASLLGLLLLYLGRRGAK